jgi:hypothetical protein
MFRVMLGPLEQHDMQVAALDNEFARRAREDEVARRLTTIPGIGPIAATAITALAPAMETFKRGRDFAAWLGLTPRQMSTGGKTKLGRTSKMRERTLRRLLIIGASAVVQHASRRGPPAGSWFAGMLARKPTDADHGGAGGQDRTHRLGSADDKAGLQSSGGVRINRPPPEAVGGRQAIEGEYSATVGKDGIGKPGFALVPRARLSDLDPIRELPYWPAAQLHQQAGQMAASDRSA